MVTRRDIVGDNILPPTPSQYDAFHYSAQWDDALFTGAPGDLIKIFLGSFEAVDVTIHRVYFRITDPFVAPGLTALSLAVGTVTDLDEDSLMLDLYTDLTDPIGYYGLAAKNRGVLMDDGRSAVVLAADQVQLTWKSVGADINTFSAGSADIIIEYALMPNSMVF